MRRLAAAAACAAFLASAAAPALAQARSYRARLSQVPVDSGLLPSVTGSGTVTATVSGNKLTITGSYEGLRTAATVARIHRGAKGIRGPAVLDLKVSGGTEGTISGAFDLTAAQVEDLTRERFYVQLHSEKAPDGNLWGWLLPQETRK
jgi:hypothetical protein